MTKLVCLYKIIYIMTIDTVRTFFRNIPKHIWILALIVLVGIFFRVYHFDDWLSFKGDGFRDAIMVSNSYQSGIESLPLLGPRAAGTMLRLGPIFYYFQYTAVSIFDSMSAPVLAYPDLFFSILAIPMLYIFARRYFDILWSLILSGMLSLSFLAIEYGRFAWNPNSMIFFILVFSFAVLRVFDTDPLALRKRLPFAVLAGLSFGVISQLHFSSFLGLPIILTLFLLWRWSDLKKVLSLKVILCFMVSVLLLYTPVFMSEYFKKGENSQQFISALSSKPSVHGPIKNLKKEIQGFASQSARATLGMVEPGKKDTLFSALFLALGFLANIFLLRGERNESRRNFLQWTLLLMTVYFILYLPLAYSINRPRFFLPLLSVFYIYCAYIILALEKRFGRTVFILVLLVFGVSTVILSNLHSTLSWFSSLRESEQVAEIVDTDRNIKGRSFWLVWTHFEKAAAMMDAGCQGDAPIFFLPSRDIQSYGRSIKYALLLQSPNRSIILERKYDPKVSEGCHYFVSRPYGDEVPELIQLEPRDESVNLGGIRVMRFYPTNVVGTYVPEEEDEPGFTPEKRTKNSRVYWGDIVNWITGEK